MSRAWIAFYMGDYDKDTQDLTTLEHGAYFLLLKQCWVHGNIPLEPAKRAIIAKMTLREWNKVAPTVNRFFDEDGCQSRATKEIAKAEVIRTKRAIAGSRGGTATVISRAKSNQMPSKTQAIAKQIREQNTEQISSSTQANHNNNIKPSTGLSVEREARQGRITAASPELAEILARKITA